MSSLLTSQGLVFATAMAISAGTLILYDLFKEKEPTSQTPPPPPPSQDLPRRASGPKKAKKKRVQFADGVKESNGNGESYRREHRKSSETRRNSDSCANEVLGFKKMPMNHMALYSGIRRDRVQRIGCSYSLPEFALKK